MFLLKRLADIGEFSPGQTDVINLNSAITQGLQRLAADTQDFRSRNRGRVHYRTPRRLTTGADTARFIDNADVREQIEAGSAEVAIVGLESPLLDADDCGFSRIRFSSLPNDYPSGVADRRRQHYPQDGTRLSACILHPTRGRRAHRNSSPCRC